jgi:PAS domain S-box-containing protein
MAATTGAIGIAGLLGLGYLNRSRKYKASLRELDARRQAEESLRQSVERFHSFTSSTFEGICLHEDARILEVNDQYAALFGYARDELIGKDIPALVAPESLSLVGEMINARSESVYAHRALRKDGSTFIAEVRGRKTVWEGREVRVAALRDVTERQRLQEALERKNKELESVIYISSHDLRSPLVNIQGFSHRLRTGCEQLEALLGPAETLSEVQEAATPILRDRLQPALSFILSSVLKMDGLLNGLLRLSRLGRSAMRIDDLDMNKIAAIATDSIAFELQNIGGCVSVGVLPPCRGDATQVAQVVSNLLDNALKYRDAQRPLRISIRGQVREGQCAYVVEDNGRGITHEHQEKIWEIFQRVDPAGPVKGEGLGLAIVRRILERHGGQAWVESGTDGKVGSRFWFTLPSAQKPTQPAAGAPTREGQAAEFSTTL